MKNGKFEKEDLKELNEFYKENGPMTCSEFREMIEDIIENSEETQESVEFWNIVLESLSEVGSLFIYDVKDEDGYMVINDIMETLHYDNGKPLSCDDYDYFDQYDRDQDYWSFYEDVVIDHFELDKDGNVIQVVVMTKEELTDILTDWYDGSSWEHDFGK